MEARYVLLGIFAFSLLCGSASALTYVDSCRALTISGETYVLNASLAGSYSGGVCLDIQNDRITLDCDKQSITSNSSIDITGIRVQGDHVLVTGCTVSGYSYDFYSGSGLESVGNTNTTVEDSSFDGNDIGVSLGSSDSKILRTSAAGNAYAGFAIANADRITLADDYANKNQKGFRFLASDYLLLQRDRASGSGESGFEFIGCSHARIDYSNATGNDEQGFYMYSYIPESYSNFTGNRAEGNGNNGFLLLDEDNNRFVDNVAIGNVNNGFHIRFDGSANPNGNVLIDNNASGNGFGFMCMPGNFPCPINGFLVEDANYTRLAGNHAEGNAGAGFFIYKAIYTVLEGNSAVVNEQHGFWVSSHEDTRRSLNNLTRNAASSNFLDGFFVQDDRNRLVENNATGNGANGFEMAQPFCVGGNCSGNDNVLIGNIADSNGYLGPLSCEDPNGECYNGFLMVLVNGTNLSGNSAIDNGGHGFRVYSGSYNSMDSDLARGNGGNGFYLDTSGAEAVVGSRNSLTRDRAERNDLDGFSIRDDRNTVYLSNATSNSGNGFSVTSPTSCTGCSAEYNNLSGNIAESNLGDGFHVFQFSGSSGGAGYGTLDDNIAYDNGNVEEGSAGFFISAPYTVLRRNVAYDNAIEGFFVDSTITGRVTGVNLSGNTAYGHHYCDKGCSGAGFKFAGTTVAIYSAFQADMDRNIAYDNDYGVTMHTGDLTMSRDRLFANDYDFEASNPNSRSISDILMSRVIFDEDAGDLQNFTTLDLEDNLTEDVELGGQGFYIDHAVQPTVDLPYGESFHGKFVEIGDLCSDPRACFANTINYVAWRWSADEIAGFSGLELWEYTAERWVLRNDTQSMHSPVLSLSDVDGLGIYALLANQSGQTGSTGGDGGSSSRLTVDVETSCNKAIISVEGNGRPIQEARVAVGDSVYFTNSSGQVAVDIGCGQAFEVYASMGGYSPFPSTSFSMPSCSQCGSQCSSDTQCPAGDTCEGGQCVPGPGCQSDSQCPSGERCSIGQCVERPGCTADKDCANDQVCDAATSSCKPKPQTCVNERSCCVDDSPCSGSESCQGGICKPVVPGQCGYASGHKWIQYQGEELARHCGEAGCPSCPPQGNVSGGDCYVGAPCHARSDPGYVVVADGDGNILSEGSWQGGDYPIDSGKPGRLTVSLYDTKGGRKLSSAPVNIIAQPAPAPGAQEQGGLLSVCPLPVVAVISLALLGLIAYYLMKMGKKK